MNKPSLKNILSTALISGIVLHATTGIRHTVDQYNQLTNPDPITYSANDACQTRVFGDRAEREEWDVSALEKACTLVSQFPGYTPTVIEFESSNYLRKSLSAQFNDWMLGNYAGLANPKTNTITLTPEADYRTILHELAHIKTYSTLKEHPEFKQRWEAIVTDENGNSPYKHKGPIASMINKIGWFDLVGDVLGFEEKRLSRATLEELGFVSEYAMTNFYEDVAETSENVLDSLSMSYFSFSLLRENTPRLEQKIDLLEEYEFIPKNFTEFREVKKALRKATTCSQIDGCWSNEHSDWYIEQAEKFLEKFPDDFGTRIVMGDLAAMHAYEQVKSVDVTHRDAAFSIWEELVIENMDWQEVYMTSSSLTQLLWQSNVKGSWLCAKKVKDKALFGNYGGADLSETRKELKKCFALKEQIQPNPYYVKLHEKENSE